MHGWFPLRPEQRPSRRCRVGSCDSWSDSETGPAIPSSIGDVWPETAFKKVNGTIQSPRLPGISFGTASIPRSRSSFSCAGTHTGAARLSPTTRWHVPSTAFYGFTMGASSILRTSLLDVCWSDALASA